MARLSVMGCGRATEAPARTVNNYRDVRAARRMAALTAVTRTQGTVRRWRSVRSRFMIPLPTMNYKFSYEPVEMDVTQQRVSKDDKAGYADDRITYASEVREHLVHILISGNKLERKL